MRNKQTQPTWGGHNWRPGKREGEFFRHSNALGPIVYRTGDNTILILKTKSVLKSAEEYSKAVGSGQKTEAQSKTHVRISEWVTQGLIKHPVNSEKFNAFTSTWREVLTWGIFAAEPDGCEKGYLRVIIGADELKRLIMGSIIPENELYEVCFTPQGVSLPGPVDLEKITKLEDLEGLSFRINSYKYRYEILVSRGTLTWEKTSQPLPIVEKESPSSSIDAGMPGNEDGAWGSSSSSGWRVD